MTTTTTEIAGHEVRFVPAKRFKEPVPHKFKEILERLLENLDQVAEITCDDTEAAKELQSGFHSSGTGRRLKREGYRIETTCDGNVVQVRLSKERGQKRVRLGKNGKSRVA